MKERLIRIHAEVAYWKKSAKRMRAFVLWTTWAAHSLRGQTGR